MRRTLFAFAPDGDVGNCLFESLLEAIALRKKVNNCMMRKSRPGNPQSTKT
jgi:hypothetical protein